MSIYKWFGKAFILLCIFLVLFIGIKNNIFADSLKRILSVRDYGLVINEVMAANRNYIQDDEGNYSDYVEIYNKSDNTVPLKGFGLTNKPNKPFLWRFPDIVIAPKSFLIIWISGKNKYSDGVLHTNFILGKNDNALVLTEPSGTWKTVFPLYDMHDNISSGRKPDGSANIEWFNGGTAGTANTLKPLKRGCASKRLPAVSFSAEGGFCEKSLSVTLSHEDCDAQIYYTLDGSVPTKDSIPYKSPIYIPPWANVAVVIRACAFKEGYPPSFAVTRGYFVRGGIQAKYDIPVISIATDPRNLYDYETGIFVGGKIQDDWKKANPKEKVTYSTPGNYTQEGKKWERQAHLEVIEPNGKIALSQGIGIRTQGGYSLWNPNKSLQLRANNDYDDREMFYYDFFPNDSEADLPVTAITLRTSATDCKASFFRDTYIQSLADPEILDLQKTQPCIVYINGEYWGIYNIRTKYDETYFKNKYGINEEDLVVLKNPSGDIGLPVEIGFAGDELSFCKLYDFIRKNDMRLTQNYRYAETMMDIDNYIEYNILEIFCGNDDWPANNVRVWRKRTNKYDPRAPYGQDGRWRWLIFDLDCGFGLFGKSYEINTLAMATAIGSTEWRNTYQYTIMLRKLLQNDEFRTKFIDRFVHLLNTRYHEITAVAKLNEFRKMYAPYVQDHINRWNLHKKDIENWEAEIRLMREYALRRPGALREHICEYFGINMSDLKPYENAE